MASSSRTAVFIVDDLAAMRERLRELISDVEGMYVVGDAGSPKEAIDGIRRTRPDCVLLDYQLVDGTGIDVIRAIHPQWPQIVFIVLTNHATPQHRRACVDAGARFFFDKSTEFAEIGTTLARIDAMAHPFAR